MRSEWGMRSLGWAKHYQWWRVGKAKFANFTRTNSCMESVRLVLTGYHTITCLTTCQKKKKKNISNRRDDMYNYNFNSGWGFILRASISINRLRVHSWDVSRDSFDSSSWCFVRRSTFVRVFEFYTNSYMDLTTVFPVCLSLLWLVPWYVSTILHDLSTAVTTMVSTRE